MNLLLALILMNIWIYNSSNDDPGIQNVKVLHHDKRVGLLKSEGGVCFVVHRGTWSLEDVLYDLESELYQKCNYNGFLEPFYESYEHDTKVDTLIMDSPCREVYYTGHSLGGVTARMAAAFANHNATIKNIITFGEPRSCCGGNQTLKSLRILNDRDPIPSLPGGEIPHHCSPISLELVSKTWHYSKDYPNKLPSHPLYDLYEYHRAIKYENSVRRYINKAPVIEMSWV